MKLKKESSIIFGLCMVAIFGVGFILLLNHLHMEDAAILLMLFLGVGLVIALVVRKTKNIRTKRNIVKGFTIILFVCYSFVLFSLLFLSTARHIGRGQGVTVLTSLSELNYARINLIPFATISNYINHLQNETLSVRYVLYNLIGNLIAFAPLGVFLPILFKAMKKSFAFILTVLVIVLLVESVQLIFFLGSCDIDDVILNTVGAIILFYLMKIPLIQKLLAKCHFN